MGEETTTKVNPEAISNAVDALTQTEKKVVAISADYSKLAKSLASCWEGPVGEAFVAYVGKTVDDIATKGHGTPGYYQARADELKGYLEGYQEASKEAKAATDEIVMPDWPDEVI